MKKNVWPLILDRTLSVFHMQICVHGIEVEFRSSLQHDACSKPSNHKYMRQKWKLLSFKLSYSYQKGFYLRFICSCYFTTPPRSLLNGEDKILHFIMYIYNQSNQASCLYNIRTLMSYTWSSYNSVLFPFNWHKKVLLGYHLTFYTSSSQQDSASDVCSVGYFFLENC